jgi:hypothetical protein
MGLTGDVVSRMVMSRRWTGDDVDTEEMRAVVAETAELTGTFNLQDYIGVFKHWDVQGLGKRVNAVHRKFDAMMERILTARDAERRRRLEEEAEAAGGGGEGEGARDVLDMLFDMHEDEAAEMRLTRDNIKAFMLVRPWRLFLIPSSCIVLVIVIVLLLLLFSATISICIYFVNVYMYIFRKCQTAA